MIDLLIVTGGSKGIGKNIVLNASSYAKKVLAIGSSDLIHNVSDIKKNIFTIKRDISRIDKDFDELSDFLKKYNPSSIGLALCASKIGNFGGIVDADFKDWENLYRINVLGNLSILQNILKFSDINTFIRAIFFGGGGAAYGYPDFSGYSLSKVAVVRAVENIGIEFKKDYKNASIVALAPGAVNTDMLAIVESHGGEVKTRTSIDEPTNFVFDFILDKIPSIKLNGSFVHVRDDCKKYFQESLDTDHFKLRRID
jgi:NAD(P)-dependent dehydrogenase (short-subunit alcohol dehydrogenase family)